MPELEFWDRPEIKRAVRAINDYASTIAHRAMGSSGYPASSSPDPGPPSTTPDCMPTVQANFLIVSNLIIELGNPVMLKILLWHAYPTRGDYARSQTATEYRKIGNPANEHHNWPNFQKATGIDDNTMAKVVGLIDRWFIEKLAERLK